jgi:hypothetical protein
MVRFDAMVLIKVWNGGDGWNLSGHVACHAQIC